MRVLLVDDHRLLLEGLTNLLQAHGIQVAGAAVDGLEAVTLARSLKPDLILMDIRMPRCDGLEATRLIKAEAPDIKIVILTSSLDDQDLFEAIRSGASGYLLKSLDAAPFLTYLQGVMRGEAAISREMAGALLNEFARQSKPLQDGEDVVALTPRQTEILQLVAQGFSYKEVADQVCLSEHTVKYHMGEILQRLHLKNREQVVAYALRTGLLHRTK
jgi:DNA-binding NarL/FixJ family response regulator